MEMTDLVKMFQERQGKMSIEEYANKMGLRGATLSRCYNEERTLGIDAIRKMAEYFSQKGDIQMLHALSAYALGMDIMALASSPN